MGFPGRLLNDGEYVVVTTRTHGKALAGPVLVPLATTFLAAFAAGRADRELTGPTRSVALLAITLLAGLLVLRWVVVPVLRWSTTTYTFTNRRFIARAGVLTREGRTVPLDRITGLDVEKGVLDRLLGCGTLVVSDAGEDGRLELHDIPGVEVVQTRVADHMHRLRHQVLAGHGGEGATDDAGVDHRS